ncbi:hypothetical protein H920_12749 [Fukomys damarensis]|uniref:Uncharacterized protein n=1 Tax=Fukomys damarensis TaxID=885580 RepID=A0A091DSR7_FUKDA|nr:hypothetical protein H920_12749 [Fukomys damarensis]
MKASSFKKLQKVDLEVEEEVEASEEEEEVDFEVREKFK